MPSGDGISIFSLDGSTDYAERVARHLEMPLVPLEDRAFEDGEHKIRPLADVRRQDVFVIHSLHGDDKQSGNDKLCRLLFFIGALRDAGAERITAITPYLCYARKDRRTKPFDPVTTKYVAQMFEAVGTDRIVTIDVHNPAAFQNAFRCWTNHVEARPLFVDHFARVCEGESVVVVSPDIGGTKRAEEFRLALAAKMHTEPTPAFMEKRRSGGVVTGERLIGDVKDRTAVIIDDLVSTGTTLRRAAHACLQAGAARIHVAATHGLFVGDAPAVVADASIHSFVVTDTVPAFRLAGTPAEAKITVLDSARLIADAIIDDRSPW